VKLGTLTLAVSLVWFAGSLAHADDAVDVAPFKEKLRVFTDGKQRYLVFIPFTYSDDPLDYGFAFYGDGKTMHAQRRVGGGRDGKRAYSFSFWEPRAQSPAQSMVNYRDQRLTITCEDRKTTLTRLSDDEARTIVDGATWLAPKWNKQAFALARDNRGVYYYVDKDRQPEDNRNFRVFKGPKGALKPQKMINVVLDANGTIFVTKQGKLRLVLDRSEQAWIAGKAAVKLTPLDLMDNRKLIYKELGVYAGELYGTPCDDW
jgi:hypothetical protein